MTPWLITALTVLAAIFILWQYRLARRETETFRAEAKRRMDELSALGFSQERVGRRVAAMGEASLEAMLVCRSDHTVIYLNPVAESLFGQLSDANRSLIAITRHHEIDNLATEALALNNASPGGYAELDRQLLFNGHVLRARAATYDGGAIIALTDVSELQRLGRARRDFIANISHELRTPLTAIRLLTDTLKGPAGRKPDVAMNLIDKITVETEALSQLAQELLDLSAIESGQAMIKMLPLPLKPVIEAPVARLAELAATKKLSVSVEVGDDLRALMDAAQVERVVLNLLHNAIKFTPAEGCIRLNALPVNDKGSDGEWLQVGITDTGPGIAPDDLPRIFERFYRADRARSRDTGGTGLGLAIAKHIVTAHGGKIWAESEGVPGRGSTFYFTLPVADRPA